MLDIKVGYKLPDDFMGSVQEGLSGIFASRLTFILKMEDLTSDDIKLVNENKISIDLLELDMYKESFGNIYAFSVAIEGFIDNSEVMIDLRANDIEELMPTSFKDGNGIKTVFAVVDEDDNVLVCREFMLGTEISNVISDKSYKQNQSPLPKNEENTDYILLAFQEIFKNEPEENLKLYSIGRTII